MLLSLLIALPLFYVLGGRSVGALYRSALQRARRDGLTDLDNHRAFQDELARAVGESARYGTSVTLALLDIDDFKFENDRHGHQHGDRLLCELSALLRESRAGDRAFRLGGDEFALLLAHTDEAEADVPLGRIRSEVERRLSGVTTSIGFSAVAPEDREPSTLWGRADAALLEAKRRGGNAIVAAAEVVDSVPVVTIEKVRAVRALIDAGAVDVAFQPIWDLSGTRVLGYEALARPRSSELSGPGEAFEIADSIGRGHELDAVCRRATLRLAGDLPPGALLFLNVSPQSLEHDALAGDSLVLAVRGAGYEPEQVVLEITERTDARKELLIPEAARLRALGFKLALDDVGAGNAGLEMLSALPVDFIKIDRAVVSSAVEDRGARAVMLAIMAFARESGSFVIAEGIESEAMLELARDPHPNGETRTRRRAGRPGLPARPARARARGRAELLDDARDPVGPDRGARAPAHRGGAAGRRRALPRAPAHRPRHGRRAVRPRHALPGRRRRDRLDRAVARDPRGQDRARGARRGRRRRGAGRAAAPGARRRELRVRVDRPPPRCGPRRAGRPGARRARRRDRRDGRLPRHHAAARGRRHGAARARAARPARPPARAEAQPARLAGTLPGMADVAMPRLSDSMEEGTILKWLKSDGDEVKRGEELVEIETDKANMTYEADSDGVLSIVAKEGDTLPVGETIARLGDGSEGGGADEAEDADEEPQAEEDAGDADAGRRRRGRREDAGRRRRRARRSPPPRTTTRTRSPPATASPPRPPSPRRPRRRSPRANGDGDGRVKASPVAKRMAREMGVELGRARGQRPGRPDREGRRRGRRRRAAARRPPRRRRPREEERQAPAAEEKKKDVPPPVTAGEKDGKSGRGDVTHQDLTRLQQTVARRMAESKATAPDFVINVEVDMEEAVEFRKQLKAAAGDDPAPSFNDFVIKASALALRDFPRANGAYRDGKFELYSRVNVGVAVAGQDALVVPTVFDADTKSLGTDRPRVTRGRRAGPRRRGHPARALERHVHRLEPRHVRHQALRRRHQPAAGRDPRGRRARAAAGRARRRGDRALDHGAHALLRPPHPLRRRRRGVPRQDPRVPRAAAPSLALSKPPWRR